MTTSPDILGPQRVLGLVRDHDNVLGDGRDRLGLANAIYANRFWAWWIGWSNSQDNRGGALKWSGAEIEVNRLRGVVSTTTSALWPRANRVVCGPDAEGRGDERARSLALNAWWNRPGRRRQARASTAMGMLFGMYGHKVSWDDGPGSPIERTQLRVIPPWEILVDRNATNTVDERFRGHIFWESLQTVLDRFPELHGRVHGRKRKDFFEDPKAQQRAADQAAASQTNDPDGDFVRVLELSNLVDSATGSSGQTYQGRLEVWILDQGEVSDKPVRMEPMPFADSSGRPLPHIEIVTFDEEPGYPFRFLPPVRTFIDLLTELNKYRTYVAEGTRRDARKGFRRKDAIGQEAWTKFLSASDMEYPEADIPEGMPLSDVIWNVPPNPINSDIIAHMDRIERDFQVTSNLSPNALKEVTNATKYELENVQAFAENELGEMGMLVNEGAVGTSRLALRAMIACMMPVSQVKPGGVTGGLTPAVSGEVVEQSATGDGSSEIPDEAPIEAEPEEVEVEIAVEAVSPSSFTLKDREDVIEITPESLEGEGEISFTESGRTPLSNEAMLDFLTGKGLEGYIALWQAAQKEDDPLSILAYAAMEHLAERADLPKDMHPEELRIRWKKLQAAKPKKAPVVAAPAGAPAPAPAGPGTNALVDAIHQAIDALRPLGPEAAPLGQSLVRAAHAAESGSMDGVRQGLSEAAHLLAQVNQDGPPEEQQQALEQVTAIVTKIGQALQQTSPDEGAPANAPMPAQASAFA